MKTIKHNGKTLLISSPEERAIHLIASDKIIKRSDLREGSGKRSHYAVDTARIPGTVEAGSYFIKEYPKQYPKFVRDFIKNNPRVNYVLYDDRGAAKRLSTKLK